MAGKQDGLFSADETIALVSAGFAAASSGAAKVEPYHGYYFRVLKGQGAAATLTTRLTTRACCMGEPWVRRRMLLCSK